MEGIYILRLVYLAVTTICIICFSIALFRRRRSFLVSNRVPSFIFVFNIWSVIQNAILLVPWTPCYLVNFTSWLALPLQINTVLFRCLFILLQARIQQRLKNNLKSGKSEALSSLSQKITKKNLLITYIIAAILFLLIAAAQASYVTGITSHENETIVSKCTNGRDDSFRGLLLIVYFAIFIAVTIFMRKVEERLHIKKELLIIAIDGICFLIVAFLSTFGLSAHKVTQVTVQWIASATASTVASAVFTLIPLYYLRSEEKLKATDLSDIAISTAEPSPPDSRGNSLNFSDLIGDATESVQFQEFLAKEFSLENLLFVKAVQQFRKIENESELKEYAKKIQRNFIGARSGTQVNVAGAISELILEQIATGKVDRTLFDSAYQQVYELLKYGAFPRFLKSLSQE